MQNTLTSIYGLFICTCYWTVVHGLEGRVKYSMSVQTTRYWPSSCRKTSVYDTMFSCFNLCRTFACHRSFRKWVRLVSWQYLLGTNTSD